jgi:dephospho-CoA kinase
MMAVGLTGSIATGKTEVAKLFLAHGIPVFDADKAVHELYAAKDVACMISTEFPDAVVDGVVNRDRLSAHLQKNSQDFARLESIVHPLVKKKRDDFVTECRRAGQALAVLDIPLLFETGAEKEVDCVVLVAADEAVQRQRALARPGITEAKLQAILARQLPQAEKRKRADFVIENSGSLQNLVDQVTSLTSQLEKRAKAYPS